MTKLAFIKEGCTVKVYVEVEEFGANESHDRRVGLSE